MARHRRLWIACLALLTLQPLAAARAQPDDYDRLVQEAVREFDDANYQEARALFQRAHAQRPSARTSRALGFCSFELHQYVQAIAELDAALGDSKHALTEEQRAQAAATLSKAQSYVGRLTLVTDPVQAKLVIDGRAIRERALQLDPGAHVIVASARGFRSRELTITILGGSEQTVQLPLVALDLEPARAAVPGTSAPASALHASQPPASDTAITERWWFWTALGVVAAGAALTTLVMLSQHPSKVDAGQSGVLLESLRREARR
jgi:tetratricopeptide (TPR) repeat protein